MQEWQGGFATLAADEAYADRPAEREEYKEIPLEPEWPVEHLCEQCGERIYRVEAPDCSGDAKEVYVEIDVDPMDLVPGNRALGETVARRDFTYPDVRVVGGHQLLDPELFMGFEGRDPAWLWFTRKMTLEEAHLANDIPLHPEHFTTCKALTRQAVIGKLMLASSKPRKPKKTIHLQSAPEPEQESPQEPEQARVVEPEESAHQEATDHHRMDSEDDQLALF